MTANELADWVIDQFPYAGFQIAKKVACMLRQLEQEKKVFEGQESNYLEMINDRDIQIAKLNKEITQLKSKVQYWKGFQK
jgi:hypothetical protein